MVDKKQIVYVLTNPAMPGIVKIGRTTDLAARVASLDNSSVPSPFECAYAAEVDDAIFVERQLHTVFLPNRIRGRREFFRVDPVYVIAAIELAEVANVTPASDDAKQEQDALRPPTIVRFDPNAYSKDGARSDVLDLLRDADFIPGQTVLVQRWSVAKGTVSKWLDDFCSEGLIQKTRVGKRVILSRPGFEKTPWKEPGAKAAAGLETLVDVSDGNFFSDSSAGNDTKVDSA